MENILSSASVYLLIAVTASAIAVTMVLNWLFSRQQGFILQRRLASLDEGSKRQNKILLLKMLGPFRSILLDQVQILISDKKRKSIDQRLTRAGLTEEQSIDEFFLHKFAMSLFLGVVVPLLLTIYNAPPSLATVILLLLIGFFLPDFIIYSAAKNRMRQIRTALPYAIDLLTLSVEAGLDFMAAIVRMIQKSKTNALMEEFKVMEQEVRLGTTRSDALRNLATRCNIEELNSLVNLLIQSDQLGVGIGQILRAQADEMRTLRFTRAETEGAKASQKLLIPMIFCIFPAVFFVIIGPLIVKWLTQGLM